jgi:hypothetical protein
MDTTPFAALKYNAPMNKLNYDMRLSQAAKARRKRTYGIEPEVYDAILIEQNGRCAICFKNADLHIDHDHKTGKPRGLLCGSCNRGLGLFQDDPAVLQLALYYLTDNQ